MNKNDRVELVCIRNARSLDSLASAIAKALDVELNDVRVVVTSGPSDYSELYAALPSVRVGLTQQGAGFRFQLCVRVGWEVESAVAGLSFAGRLAKELGQDVLASVPDNVRAPPWARMLARPTGEFFLVYEKEPDDTGADASDDEVDLEAAEIDCSEGMQRMFFPLTGGFDYSLLLATSAPPDSVLDFICSFVASLGARRIDVNEKVDKGVAGFSVISGSMGVSDQGVVSSVLGLSPTLSLRFRLYGAEDGDAMSILDSVLMGVVAYLNGCSDGAVFLSSGRNIILLRKYRALYLDERLGVWNAERLAKVSGLFVVRYFEAIA